MKLIKQLSFLSSSVFIRLICGSLLVFVMARSLGPSLYGELVLYIAFSSITILLIDLGFQTFIVKEISGNHSKISELINCVIIIKVLLLPLFFITLYISSILFIDSLNFSALFYVSCSIILLNTGDFLNIPLRVVDKYNIEARNIFIGAIINLIFVSMASYLLQDVNSVALSMFVSRFLYFIICTKCFHTLFHLDFYSVRFCNVKLQFKKVIPFALDSANVTVRSHIDVIILGMLSSTYYVGLYQAGLTLTRSLEKLAIIISNVFLVELIEKNTDTTSFKSTVKKMLWSLFTLGSCLLIGFILLGDFIVRILFGDNFIELVELMPWFGLYVFLRFIACGFGVLLTAMNKQKIRVIVGSLSTLLLIPLLFYSVIHFGITGAVLSQILISFFIVNLFCFYSIKGWR